MIYSENSALATASAILFQNKLKNLRMHLSELKNKKIRISLEIKSLTKILTNKKKEYEKSLRLKIKLETGFDDLLNGETQILLENKFPELHHSILLIDEEMDKVELLLREISEEKIII